MLRHYEDITERCRGLFEKVLWPGARVCGTAIEEGNRVVGEGDCIVAEKPTENVSVNYIQLAKLGTRGFDYYGDAVTTPRLLFPPDAVARFRVVGH